MLYSAFISYSHAADEKLAPAIQHALHTFTKPWYQLRALRVFRDKTSLSANPGLWPAIERALSQSEWFLFMASPQAAQSRWVQQEIAWWIEHRECEKLLILLTDGELVWDDTTNDFNWSRTSAVPNSLRSQFPGEPLHVDLRWAKTEDHLSLRHQRFRGAILDLASPLQGKPKEELDGEDVRQHRRTKRAITIVVMLVVALIGVAVWQSSQKLQQQRNYYLTQAEAVQRDTSPGRQFACLDWLKQAARIQSGKELKNRAIACMALSDLKKVNEWDGFAQVPVRSYGRAFDSNLHRYAGSDDQGNISIRHTDGSEISVLPGAAEPVHSFPGEPTYGSRAWVIRFSGDGRFLAAKYERDHELRIWDLNREEQTRVTKKISDSAFNFSPDGHTLAFGKTDGSISLYDLESRKENKWIVLGPAQNSEPNSLAFHPQGRLLAVSSLERDIAVRIFDLSEDKAGDVIQPKHPAGVRGIAWSPDGRLLAAACADSMIYVWDVATPDIPVAVLRGHQAEATFVAFNHDGSLLASTGWDGTIRLWDPFRGTELISTPGRDLMGFSQDGGLLAFILGESNALSLWKLSLLREYRTFFSYREREKGPWSADFSTNGHFIASAHSDGVRIWDSSDGREIAFLDPRLYGSKKGYTRSVILHPDGKRLITAGASGLLEWPIEFRGDSVPLVGPARPIRLPLDARPWWASLAADGRTLAVADHKNDQVIVLDLDDESKDPILLPGHAGIVFVKISQDGRLIVSGSWKQQPTDLIRVSEVKTGRLLRQFQRRSITVSADFSLDGKWLVTGSEKGYQLLEVDSGKSFAPFPPVVRVYLSAQ